MAFLSVLLWKIPNIHKNRALYNKCLCIRYPTSSTVKSKPIHSPPSLLDSICDNDLDLGWLPSSLSPIPSGNKQGCQKQTKHCLWPSKIRTRQGKIRGRVFVILLCTTWRPENSLPIIQDKGKVYKVWRGRTVWTTFSSTNLGLNFFYCGLLSLVLNGFLQNKSAMCKHSEVEFWSSDWSYFCDCFDLTLGW